MNDDYVEQITEHLRELAERTDDPLVDEAADLIDRLYADAFLAREELATLTAPPPSMKDYTPEQQRLLQGAYPYGSSQRRETSRTR